jgi:hypothetical protein
MLKITGTLESAEEIVIRKDSQNREYRSRNFMLNISSNPSYPNYAQFQLEGDKCSIVSQIKQGETIEVGFGLKGRKYTKQTGEASFYQTLVVMSVATISRQYVNATGSAPAPETAQANTAEASSTPTSNGADKIGEDIF